MKLAPLLVWLASLAACGRPQSGQPSVIPTPSTGSPTTAAAVSPCADRNAAPLADDEAFGRNVVAVCIENASANARETIAKQLKLREGSVLRREALAEDLARVHASGIADDVAAHGRRSGSGVVLVIALRERARIGKVDVHGSALASVGVRRALHAMPLRPGQYYEPAYAFECALALEDAYRAVGFAEATVRPKTVVAGEGVVDVHMMVVEGERSLFGKIAWKGATKIREADLVKAAQLKEGDVFDKELLERAPLFVAALYYDHGFSRVEIHVERGARDASGKVPITFFIREGDVFRVAKIAFKNVDVAEKKRLSAVLATKSGQIFSRATVLEDLQRMRADLAVHGRNEDVQPETELDVQERTIDITFVVGR